MIYLQLLWYFSLIIIIFVLMFFLIKTKKELYKVTKKYEGLKNHLKKMLMKQ